MNPFNVLSAFRLFCNLINAILVVSCSVRDASPHGQPKALMANVPINVMDPSHKSNPSSVKPCKESISTWILNAQIPNVKGY